MNGARDVVMESGPLSAEIAGGVWLPSTDATSGYSHPDHVTCRRMIITSEHIDVGNVRVLVCKPKAAGRFPGVIFFSDIFQLTPPHIRLAQRLAGHGFVVAAPEMYGRIEPKGTVLDFDKDRQRALDNADKMNVDDLDRDRRAVLDWLKPQCSTLLAAGWCFGGHLAFRAALEPDVRASVAFYGTGIHANRLSATSNNVDTLARCQDIKGDLLLVWGRNDPHIPADGRAKIHRALDDAGVRWRFSMYDAEHAFMRDEGPRYDPGATDSAFAEMVSLFRSVTAG
jgi:carboxymethylenebutenolidase